MTPDDDAPSRIQLPPAPRDQQALLDAGGVACWSEAVSIDTYDAGHPDRYPLFLDRRVYQGSSGRVYPLPMTDAVSHTKRPREWQAIHLENAYVRLMLLPEIGGRIHIGYDKVAGYDFFYRNNVIKPALVGLAGPWISGGVEFNWPQHHRPATYLPVDTRIEREEDGAVVVWHSDLDPLQRMRGTHGIRLRPGSSLIEADVELHNRTDTTQTFLWWANVAARSHEQYQSFFPDDVAYVADHARRAMTAFPRADRPYYGVDYPALALERPDADRIDIYSNIPVPTSYMITDTDDAFFGGYDHAVDAGFVHWADRAVSPGKKQWTWGTGEIGQAWDAQLTDDDGPYVELMAGVYTDNQPDFAWLVPGETKRFSQFWYPIHEIGPARQATTDAAVSVDQDAHRVGVIATRAVAGAEILVGVDDGREFSARVMLGPEAPVVHTFAEVGGSRIIRVEVRDAASGNVLVEWIERTEKAAEPWVATAPPQPDEIAASDELYVTATHLDQYRHPTRSAVAYLREALARDADDARAATALGAWHLRRGEYPDAAELLERALTRETRRNLNPRDGETLYLLGLVRERQGDLADADRRFARAAWNAVWAAPANLARARIALRQGRAADALKLADAAASIPEAGRVAVLALLRTDLRAAAAARLRALADRAPLDAATAALARATGIEAPGADRLPVDPRALLDIASEFARAGAYAEALAATEAAPHDAPAALGNSEPLRRVLRAAWAVRSGDADAAAEIAALDAASLDLAFPAGLDQYDALTELARADTPVVRALRGMWLLDAGRDADALADLTAAMAAGIADPVAWRNLGLAIVRTGGALADADAAYAGALELSADGRLVFERDLLARIAGVAASDRLALLEEHADLLATRDDLALTHVTLLLDVGRVDEAWAILTGRVFRAFEGGEGRVIAAYDRAACAIARRLLAEGEPDAAAALLRAGVAAPANLGEGRHPAVPQAERFVLLGDALAAAGDAVGAREAWQTARATTPLAVDERPADEADEWIGVAHVRLGELEAARLVWLRLENRAAELERARDDIDYFATSLPELVVFDTDTSGARREVARRLRDAAAAGRALIGDEAVLATPERGRMDV
ncbi:DUF5107 domain-containing protein [Microbacterium sp. SLBN-146]|uniref:DUF5107 domain-containing protein n=1 Tax=Microbacterium sp. SLBN-146 TaxID=2768457 RepID=UPI00115123F2|nr:DUF5107 domain-containing protein [Microbacterium sp. SLBN-146]TQJ30048.1 uncharacterized protein DUF5107 [Microbacterium sp. SLBN-146]